MNDRSMSNISSSLSGKVVWLTGATSGIGLALADELAARGARLAITARRTELLDDIKQRLLGTGGSVKSYPGDVSQLPQMKQIAEQIEADLGPIEIVIANAGNHIFTVPEKFDSKEYLDLMQLNYGGMLHCFEAVIPSMLARKRGNLVGVASLAGYRGLPRAAAYGASKAAMIHFMESIRFHLKNHGLKITIVNPGFVKTPLTDKNDFYMPFLIDSPRAARSICNGIERGAQVIAFPWPFSWIISLGRMLPSWIYQPVVDRLW
jgi:short-subunit dehydrogenase